MNSPVSKPVSAPLVVLAFATIYVVWGSTYYFIAVGVKEFPPMMLGALRFLASGGILLVWCMIRGEGFGSRDHIRSAAVTGLLMLGGGTGAVIWAEKWLPSSLAAILVSTVPFWFVLLDVPKWRQNLTSRAIIGGLVAGFIGVNLMFADQMKDVFAQKADRYEFLGLGILLAGTMSWAGGSLYSKYHVHGSTYLTSAWQMLAAGIAFTLASLLLNEPRRVAWGQISPAAWFSVAYLVIFGSLIAYSAYVWLLRVRPAAQVGTYAYVNPLIAVLLGVGLANETLTVLQIAGLVVVLGSVLTINLARSAGESGKE